MLVPHGPDSVEATPWDCHKAVTIFESFKTQGSLAGNEEALGFGFFAFGRQRAYSA